MALLTRSIMANATLRIGIVGAGANTRAKHLPLLQQIPGVKVVMVANRSAASSQAVAKEFGIPGVARHWHEVVAAPDVDAVVIGAWPNLHAEATCAALANGAWIGAFGVTNGPAGFFFGNGAAGGPRPAAACRNCGGGTPAPCPTW